MGKVFANGRSIVHQGDGLVQTCPTPDVCKTPSPGGPVPVPFMRVPVQAKLVPPATTRLSTLRAFQPRG